MVFFFFLRTTFRKRPQSSSFVLIFLKIFPRSSSSSAQDYSLLFGATCYSIKSYGRMRILNTIGLILAVMFADLHRVESNFFGFPKLSDLSGVLKTIVQMNAFIKDPITKISGFINKFGDTHSVSSNCSTALTEYFAAVFRKELWALKMIDASAKLGNGITDGNFIWAGSFSACTSIIISEFNRSDEANEVKFQPKYCWSKLSVKINYTYPEMPKTDLPVPLMIGLCLPNACTGDDWTLLSTAILNDYLPSLTKYISYKETTCIQPTPDIGSDYKAVICLTFLGVFIAIISIATAYDLYLERTNDLISKEEYLIPQTTCPCRCEDLLLRFSLYTNSVKLFNLELAKDTIPCIHGIKVLSMTWIILFHSCLIGMMNNDNMLVILKRLRDFVTLIPGQGHFALDTLFVVSGFLITVKFFEDCDKNNGEISWLRFYLTRFLRWTPAYVVVLFVFEDVLSKYYTNGPFYPQNGFNGDNCKKYWWWNVLYINNFLPMDDMCMPHAWYLATEMQFYVISPLILFFFRCSYSAIAVTISCAYILTSCIWSGLTANLLTFGDELLTERNLDLARDIYFKPYYRISPFLVGIICGYLLNKFKKTNLNGVVVLFGWLAAFGITSSVVFGVYHAEITRSNVIPYFTLARLSWAIAIAWIIYACCNGYGGIINDILSLPIWQPLSKLTYCSYLIHFVVIRIVWQTTNNTPHFSDIQTISSFLAILFITNICAGFIHLVFKAPFSVLETLFVKL